MDILSKKLHFLKEIDAFKTTYRRGYVGGIDRRENDAEHERHMCMFAILLQEELGFGGVDMALSLKIILVHDLVEIYADDVFAFDEEGKKGKEEREQTAAKALFSLLPEETEKEFTQLRYHYEHQDIPEAKFAKTIDKLQALAQNSDGRLRKEAGITEEMSRKHNAKVMGYSPKIAEVFERYYTNAVQNNLFS